MQQAAQRSVLRAARAGRVAASARASSSSSLFGATDSFERRHNGPSAEDQATMLRTIGCESLEDLVDKTVPAAIRRSDGLSVGEPMGEQEALSALRTIAEKNHLFKSFIGMGYYDPQTPAVIQRNILENPGWYTSYTPYQPEVAQGRLEALLNFQTMVTDMTGLEIAGASLLDEATAAAEAFNMCLSAGRGKKMKFFVADDVHPQTLGVVETRAGPHGVEVVIAPASEIAALSASKEYCGALLQYPNTWGECHSYADVAATLKANGTLLVVATDLLALTKLTPPGEFGADIAIGSAQRFGVPVGFGGPHAAFLACGKKWMRKMPGRVIGVSIDVEGNQCLRMAMQTREQHIRRDKATSNICTAQALLANIASSYAVYHGPEGLDAIAGRVHGMTGVVAEGLRRAGHDVGDVPFFDTLRVTLGDGTSAADVHAASKAARINFRQIDDTTVGLSLDEATTKDHIAAILGCFGAESSDAALDALAVHVEGGGSALGDLARTSDYLTHPVFNTHHSETQMLRYLASLEAKDLSLKHSMIPLGSCTMKLNATSEMMPITWPEFGSIHPFAPREQTDGYYEMNETLNADLADITGFAAMSSQPNSGAQGEFSGLMCIKGYHEANGDTARTEGGICLIPVSAHGTNPASAVMAGMKVVTVKTDEEGNIDIEDLQAKATKHSDNLAALMVTYPSTYGVYEEGIIEIIDTVHAHGGQVYMDGANMNAQVALTSPGTINADVCHLNLHKTFCIPHGGGGPGVGTIGVAEHLAPFLPGHSVVPSGGEGKNTVAKSTGAIAAAPFGSASILPISWMYIKMLGSAGLKKATQTAILNANYCAKKLEGDYKILFSGKHGMCAHEFIIDMRPLKESSGISEEDVAKRLQDFGFHAPTMSWPVAGTLMIEPTESEDKPELDRFCDAMSVIRSEIADVEEGRIDPLDNPLKNAPHTIAMVSAEEWSRPYSRAKAAYPAPWVKDHKFWPSIARVDNVYGDRNIICSCPPLSSYEFEE